MGQIVAGAAGAVVGSFFGMPGLGYTIGSALYGALNTPDPERQSQQMIDLKVTGTAYGQPLLWLRGAMRMAPQIVWNTDRIPLTTVTEVEGPGKGSAPTQEQETITYSIHEMLVFTANPIIAIPKVWDMGELIYRVDADADSATIAASEATEHWDRFTVYTGADDQLPDPDYEAAIDTEVAPDSAPAYRQRGGAFLKHLQLGQSGVVRNLTYEVVVDGAEGPLLSYFDGTASASSVVPQLTACTAYSPDTGEVWMTDIDFAAGDSADRMAILNLASESYEFMSLQSPWVSLGGITFIDLGIHMHMVPEWDRVYIQATGPGRTPLTTLVYSISSRTFIESFVTLFPDAYLYAILVGVDVANSRALIFLQGSTATLSVANMTDGVPSTVIGGFSHAGPGANVMAHADASGNFWMANDTDSVWLKISSGGGLTTSIAYGADGCRGSHTAYDSVRDCIYFWSALSPSAEHLKKIDCATGVISRVNAVAYPTVSPTPALERFYYAPDFDQVVVLAMFGNSPNYIFRIDPDDGSIFQQYQPSNETNTFWGRTFGYAPGVVWGAADAWTIALTEKGIAEYRFNVITAQCPSVQDVQESICLRSGLTAGQIDVSELASITREVCCMPWSQVSPAREPSERMMGCYFYECTMSGATVKFVPRGGTDVGTIPYADLGASLDGNFNGDPFPLRKLNDIELPAHKAITYINLSEDYQEDTQLSDRLISATSASVESTSIQIGMTPSECKSVADTHSLDQAASIAGCAITVLRLDYPELECTDPILVTMSDGSLIRMRIVEMTDHFPLLTLRLIIDDTSVLVSQGITSVDYNSQTTVAAPVASLMQLMDVPILQDSDDDAGFYVAAKGANSPWPGAAIFDSNNNVDYSRRATVSESAVFGSCTTTLGDWTGPHVLDEVNSVTVNVASGTLSSTTRALVIGSQTVNAMLIGSEIIQFIRASLVSPGIYTLSRLIRGARGTEWAMVDHAGAERCVLLRGAGLRRIVLTNSQLGDTRYYKGVTLGRAVGTASAQTFIDTGIGLKPFAPVDARVDRDGSNNATITWRRRTRMSTRYVGTMGISVPLGEESEAYVVDIYDTDDSTLATVLRTISVSAATASYTAAEQTADGITPGDGFFFAIYQMSAIVGRGYALEHFG